MTASDTETTLAAASLSGHGEPQDRSVHARFVSPESSRIGLVALATAAVWLRLWEPFPHLSVIGLTAALVGGAPIFREAFSAVRSRRMTMELSMTIAIGAALAIGEFFTALVILLFVLIAEWLEGLTIGRGRRAIKDLLDFLPRRALVRRGDGVGEVSVTEIAPGDVVVVKPGGRLSVDGVRSSRR
jgi:Cd2+/Zn2+-exporting ATPase/Cu+-exporting ATPase